MINRKYEPDFNQLLKVLNRERADRPVLFEYFTNGPLNQQTVFTNGLLTSKPFLQTAFPTDYQLEVAKFNLKLKNIC